MTKYISLLWKTSLAAVLAAAAISPTLADAASCAGPQRNWTQISDTSTNIQCNFINRGRSFGATNTQGGLVVPIRLSADLLNGTHATAVSYNQFGTPLQNCTVTDFGNNDGASKVEGGGVCASGVKHQVIVVF